MRREKESAIDSRTSRRPALRDSENQLIVKGMPEKEWKADDMAAVAKVDEELIAEVFATATASGGQAH